MGSAPTLALLVGALVLYAALFHGWIYLLRRRESQHLWLSLSALLICVLSLATAGLQESLSLEQGARWQRVMFLCTGPLLACFYRFSLRFLGVAAPRLERRVLALAGIVTLLALADFHTHWIVGDEAVVRRVPWASIRWVEGALRPFGYAVMTIPLLGFLHLIALYARYVRRDSGEVRVLLPTLCIWFLAALCDALGAVFQSPLPYVLGLGFLAIVVGMSGILIHRFVRSMDQVETLAGTLHERVEARSEALRQKELQLAHGKQLATIGALAASVAHEINNPIAFVHSNLNRLDEMWRKPDADAEVEEMLAECREGTERVRSIVSQLLHLARRSDGRTDPIHLHEVIASVLPMVRQPARRRARIATELGPIPRVVGDARLLGQVILNLVMNALQAIPEGAPERNCVTVSTSYEDGSVWVIVRDTGPGIPDALQDRIFDPFFTTKGEGTGLGLAVSHQIMSRHRGRIEVESDRRGTRVILEFPSETLAASGPDA